MLKGRSWFSMPEAVRRHETALSLDMPAEMVNNPYVATLVRKFRSRIESVIAADYDDDGYLHVRGLEHLDKFLHLVAANLPEPEYGMSATADGLMRAVWEDSRTMCTLSADLAAGTAEWHVRSKHGEMKITKFDNIWSKQAWHTIRQELMSETQNLEGEQDREPPTIEGIPIPEFLWDAPDHYHIVGA